jgi:hypothetical protein
MKRFILFAIVFLFVHQASAITGEIITGEASSQSQNISIFVLPGPPVINIYSPENKTYTSTNILLNYSIGNNFSQAWYNLDNNANISLSNLTANSLTFSTSLGIHTLYLYANNTVGLSSSNVTFSVVSEPPPVPPTDGGGGGGGGGGAVTSLLQVDKTLVEVSLLQGQDKQESVKVTNTGSRILDVTVDVIDLNGFLLIGEEDFSLAPGETKSIPLFFFSLQETPEGIYVGKINIKAGSEIKSVNVILEINELNALFDMQVEIPRSYKVVKPGETVSSKIKLINIGSTGSPIDVDLTLSIRDFERGNVYDVFRETIAINDELSLVRKLDVPENIPDGTYMIFGEVFYTNISASSYDTFEVDKDKRSFSLFWIALLIVILAIIIFLTLDKEVRKKLKKMLRIKK